MSNSLIFAVQMKKLNGGYLVEVPSLPGCHTFGKTYEEALSNAQEAIQGFVETLRLLGKPVPIQAHQTKLHLNIPVARRLPVIA